jgi:carbamoyltransferase
MTTFIGFACSQHDPAIAVVDGGGHVLFAEANERALKYKRGWHAAPDPLGLIEPILSKFAPEGPISANLTWSAPSMRSVSLLDPISRAAVAALRRLPVQDRDTWLAWGWFLRHGLYRAPRSVKNQLLNLELRLQERDGFGAVLPRRAWNHHLCHAAAACFSSPFDDALCVVMDGMGEGSSTAIFSYRNGSLKRLDRPRLANLASLGIFYSQACYAAGFDPIAGEEWKLMGLAAYGKLDPQLYLLMRGAIEVRGTHLRMSKNYASIGTRLLEHRDAGHYANADMAFTAQRVFEETLMEFLANAQKQWGGDNLVLTGGCALNSSANGKILAATAFKNLHVPMAPGDDGNAPGAALLAWQAANGGRHPPRFSGPYLGSKASTDTLERLARDGLAPCCEARDDDELTEFVAGRLAEGAIVGWMQGRAEFGPRALGNRSILADPRSPGIRDRLNATVKFREEFRPFAPSILHEFGPEYFHDYSPSPYMDRTLKWIAERAPPGVTHVDGTGRLQSVVEAMNPLYYKLIKAFHRLTGVPILLNTSFNVMGRPIIHDVEDALGVFLTSGIDYLAVSNKVFAKPSR